MPFPKGGTKRGVALKAQDHRLKRSEQGGGGAQKFSSFFIKAMLFSNLSTTHSNLSSYLMLQ